MQLSSVISERQEQILPIHRNPKETDFDWFPESSVKYYIDDFDTKKSNACALGFLLVALKI